MKLLNNFVSMGYGALYSEALMIAAKSGISREVFHSVLAGGRMDCGFFQTFMDSAVNGNREAHQFTLTNALKDLLYLESMADAVMERWFSKEFRASTELELWRNMLIRQPQPGYAGCSSAIAGTDFYTTTAALRLPALAIAGSDDGSTPPDLVRETAELIPGSKFHLIRGAGHLPCAEKPEEFARVLTEFLKETGHI